MKIFVLIPDDYRSGGIQRSAIAARECLIDGGHKVTILCVKALRGGHAERHDFIRPVSAQTRSRFHFWTRFIYDLRRLVRSEKVDVLIGLGLAPSVLGRLASFGVTELICIGSERAFPPATPVGLIWKVLRRLTFPFLDAIVSQTIRTADWYRTSLRIPQERLVVIGNVIAPPVADLQPLEALYGWKGHPIVACVGRLHPQKGFDMALQVFARTLEACPTARFLIIGEGPLQTYLSESANKLRIADKVIIHPPIKNLAQIWPAVDIFLLTSRYEGIPNVLIEAMAYGKACVSFDCPTGPAEMIEDGENGFLVPLGDCALASRRCEELIVNPIVRERVGRQAGRIIERYSAKDVGIAWNALVLRLQAIRAKRLRGN